MPLDFASPTMIEALYDDHMGDDLAVVNAAKVSFGRRSKLVERLETFANGQVADQPYWGLSEKDERLIYFLARGMTTGDYDKMLSEVEGIGQAMYIQNGLLEEAHAEGGDFTEPVAALRGYRDELSAILNHYRDIPLHRSPFNHTSIKLTAQAPIWLARQLVKHEYLVWNEVSGRYVKFEPNFFLPNVIRASVEDKKQGAGMPLPADKAAMAEDVFNAAHRDAYAHYLSLLGLGVAEEQARGVLPLDTMTSWVWTGSLGAWSKMVKLRLGSDAQDEARDMAQQVSDIMSIRFPIAWDALMTNGRLPDNLGG